MGHRVLGGVRRPGAPRGVWGFGITDLAIGLLGGTVPFAEAKKKHRGRELYALADIAQHRDQWKKLIQGVTINTCRGD
eukprot:8228642-Alexandrium_andersonii.AAC.1